MHGMFIHFRIKAELTRTQVRVGVIDELCIHPFKSGRVRSVTSASFDLLGTRAAVFKDRTFGIIREEWVLKKKPSFFFLLRTDWTVHIFFAAITWHWTLMPFPTVIQTIIKHLDQKWVFHMCHTFCWVIVARYFVVKRQIGLFLFSLIGLYLKFFLCKKRKFAKYTFTPISWLIRYVNDCM